MVGLISQTTLVPTRNAYTNRLRRSGRDSTTYMKIVYTKHNPWKPRLPFAAVVVDRPRLWRETNTTTKPKAGKANKQWNHANAERETFYIASSFPSLWTSQLATELRFRNLSGGSPNVSASSNSPEQCGRRFSLFSSGQSQTSRTTSKGNYATKNTSKYFGPWSSGKLNLTYDLVVPENGPVPQKARKYNCWTPYIQRPLAAPFYLSN